MLSHISILVLKWNLATKNLKDEEYEKLVQNADLQCLGEDHKEQPHLRRVPRQAQDWGGRGRPGEHQVFCNDHGPHLSDI